MIYVIVVTGYEGIERLAWAGEDREEAIHQVQQLRDRLAKVNARRDELEPKSDLLKTKEGQKQYHEMIHQMYRALEEEFGEDGWSHLKPDHVCVHGYDPTTNEFKCRCADLGVSPSKPMFR